MSKPSTGELANSWLGHKLCKPHKMCVACRWTNRDPSRLKEFERERKELIG